MLSLRLAFHCRSTFSESVMVAAKVSKLGYANLIFVEPAAKINEQYYRDVLQMQDLIPAIHSIAVDMFVFHQDNAPAHCASDTVELLRHETPKFISPDMWSANSCDLNLADYYILWHDAAARVLSTNPRYGRVATVGF